MARIIESSKNSRRIIQLSTEDIISIIQEYQQLRGSLRHLKEIRDVLENKVIYVPEG